MSVFKKTMSIVRSVPYVGWEISDAVYAVRMAWQRVFRGYDDSMLWGWDEAFLIHLEAAVKYHRDFGHTVPNDPNPPHNPQFDRDWKNDLNQVLEWIRLTREELRDCYDYDTETIDMERAKRNREISKRAWDEIFDFLKKDHQNLWD